MRCYAMAGGARLIDFFFGTHELFSVYPPVLPSKLKTTQVLREGDLVRASAWAEPQPNNVFQVSFTAKGRD